MDRCREPGANSEGSNYDRRRGVTGADRRGTGPGNFVAWCELVSASSRPSTTSNRRRCRGRCRRYSKQPAWSGRWGIYHPILIFAFGAEIRAAGTASVLISIPIVLTGVARHWLTGHYRSQSMLLHLVLPISLGSLIGAAAGSYLAVGAPLNALRLSLAAILAVSALKLWSKHP
jgi:hypothetical protein